MALVNRKWSRRIFALGWETVKRDREKGRGIFETHKRRQRHKGID